MKSTANNANLISGNNRNLFKNVLLRMKIERMIKILRKKVKKSKHRENVLKQWQATEETYIKDLKIIIDKIQKPLLQNSLITEEEDRVMFPNLDAMLKLSQEMLASIKVFLKNWHPNTTIIGQTLINFHKYFIIYREYCNNFYKSQNIIKGLKDNEKADTIFSQLQMDIQSYIIKPVQRPPKYQLLLRQYEKCLSRQHPDCQPLSIAISKYHQVNEQNNQSMDLQIRNSKMIELDKKYGGIISASRVYLFQEYMKSIFVESRMKMYIFNDVILIVKVYGDDPEKEKQELYKKIFLDGKSFVHKQMDGKYLTNKLFLCGIKESMHCTFINSATRDKIFQRLDEITQQLYRKQVHRAKTANKTKRKMTIMKFQQLQIKTSPKLRITVVGVEKRPVLAVNISFQTYYVLKIQAPYPNPLFQYTYMRFEDLLEIEKRLLSTYKSTNLPILDDKPNTMNFYDVKKNKTQIIECRQIYIQRFLNFIIRAEALQAQCQKIGSALGVNSRFWQFIVSCKTCYCTICLSPKDDITIDEFENQREQIKSIINLQSNFLGRNNSGFLHSQFSRSSIGMRGVQASQFTEPSIISRFSEENSSICLYNNLNLSNKIKNASILELNNLSRRLAWLQSRLGRIDYSLLPKDLDGNTKKITINVLSLKPDEIIVLQITKNSTALEILDKIGENYKIETIRDFGLFLEYQNIPRMLDQDQILSRVLNQINYEYQSQEGEKEEVNIVWKKLMELKKAGSQMILGKKPKIFIKKYIFLGEQYEIQACKSNPQRYPFIVEEIFYRYKNQLLILNKTDTKRLCALYYIINNMEKLAHLNQSNFQVEKLKALVPQAKWNIISSSNQYYVDIFKFIKQYEAMMVNYQFPMRNKKKLSGSSMSQFSFYNQSTVFSKVQSVYDCLVKLVCKVLGWNTMFYEVVNYDPPTLPGNMKELLLGINRKSLIIIRHKHLDPLLQIEMNKLEYKLTVHSIFIHTQQKIYRFDSQMMYDIKKMIEIYKLLGQKFGY